MDSLTGYDAISGDGHHEVTAAQIGEIVRRHRIKQGMRQGDLAAKAGLSTSFVSQFERGITDASIGSLTRLCAALGRTVGSLFITESESVQVLPAGDVKTISLEGAVKRVFSRPSLLGTNVYFVALDPGGSTGPFEYAHERQHELVICVFGLVVAEVNGKRHILRPGDSIDFPSEHPHRLLNVGYEQATFAWVIVDR